jgi:hypothetical protein
MLAQVTKLSHGQRASLATLLTLVGVGGMELAHAASGTSPALEISYFAIPGALAFLLFNTVKERALAFVLLTLIGFLGVATIWFIALTPR